MKKDLISQLLGVADSYVKKTVTVLLHSKEIVYMSYEQTETEVQLPSTLQKQRMNSTVLLQ